jgi:hypothetical protein
VQAPVQLASGPPQSPVPPPRGRQVPAGFPVLRQVSLGRVPLLPAPHLARGLLPFPPPPPLPRIPFCGRGGPPRRRRPCPSAPQSPSPSHCRLHPATQSLGVDGATCWSDTWGPYSSSSSSSRPPLRPLQRMAPGGTWAVLLLKACPCFRCGQGRVHRLGPRAPPPRVLLSLLPRRHSKDPALAVQPAPQRRPWEAGPWGAAHRSQQGVPQQVNQPRWRQCEARSPARVPLLPLALLLPLLLLGRPLGLALGKQTPRLPLVWVV